MGYFRPSVRIAEAATMRPAIARMGYFRPSVRTAEARTMQQAIARMGYFRPSVRTAGATTMRPVIVRMGYSQQNARIAEIKTTQRAIARTKEPDCPVLRAKLSLTTGCNRRCSAALRTAAEPKRYAAEGRRGEEVMKKRWRSEVDQETHAIPEWARALKEVTTEAPREVSSWRLVAVVAVIALVIWPGRADCQEGIPKDPGMTESEAPATDSSPKSPEVAEQSATNIPRLDLVHEPGSDAVSEREKILLPSIIALTGVVLASLAGFVAAQLTNRHQRRLEEKRWLREDQRRFHRDRRDLYARYLSLASAIFRDIEYAKGLSKGDNPLAKAVAQKYSSSVEKKNQELQELFPPQRYSATRFCGRFQGTSWTC